MGVGANLELPLPAKKSKKRKSETGRCMVAPTCLALPLYQGFSGEIRKKVHRLLYHSLCTNVVAGEGFEPTTSGLWLRPTLPHLPFAGRHRDLPANGAAAEKAGLLHPPPAAQPRFPQRAPLAGLITRRGSTQIVPCNGMKKAPVHRTGASSCGCGGRI